MKLSALLSLIIESDPSDWHHISQGPLFRDRLIAIESVQDRRYIDVQSHHTVAIYRPDISITIGFGMEWLKDFKEHWANSCPDPKASADYIDVYYAGALVYRDVYVWVDGGRAKLPIPKSSDDLVVPEGQYKFVRLIDSLGGYASRYDEYFNRVGLRIEQGDWPIL